MAERTDLEQLVFSLEASATKMNKSMKEAAGFIKTQTSLMEKQMEQSGQKAWSNFYKHSGKEGAAAFGNARLQIMELEHVLRSASDAIASGANPMRVLAQEGGRIAQVLGNGGLGGVLRGVVSMFPPVVMGVVAVGAALYATASAAMAYESEQRKVVVALLGTAAASGMTIQSLDDIVSAADKLNHQTEVTTRNMALMFAGHGVEGVDNIKQATSIVEDLAVSLGVKAPEAADLLAKALQHPEQGVKSLNEVMRGFVSGAQMHMIEQLAATGREGQAQTIMLHALSEAVAGNAEQMSSWNKMWRDLAVNIGNASNNLGNFLAHLLGYNDVSDLPKLREELAEWTARKNAADKGSRAYKVAEQGERVVQALITPLQAILDKQTERGVKRTSDLEDQHLQEVKDRADPKRAQIEMYTADIARLKKAIADDAKAGKDTTDDRKYLAGAEANLERAKRRETHIPGSGGTDQTDSQNKSAADALNKARLDLARAVALQVKDEQRKTDLEKAAVDANLTKELMDLDAKEVEIKKSKIDRNRQSQLNDIEAAKWTTINAALEKKAALDRALRAERDKADRTIADEIGRARIGELQDALGLVKTQGERHDLQLKILEAEQRQADMILEQNRQLALKADPTRSAKINSEYDELKGLQDRQYANKRAGVEESTLSPWANWAKDATLSSKEVGEAVQSYAVKSMDEFNSGLADAIANGKDLGATMKSILRQMEADLIRYLAKQAEVGLFGDGKGSAGSLSSLAAFLPHFAGGTSSAPGGAALVGEHGPEIVNIPRGAEVIPNHVVRSLSSPSLTRAVGGGPTTISLHATYDLSGAVTSQEVRAMIIRSHQEAVAKAVDIARRGAAAAANSDYLLKR